MDKLVSKGLKIDLHIHSVYSTRKDGKDKVGNNTLENLPILVNKLNEYGIEMCAITDHDYFNYDLYAELKKEEQKKYGVKKVLPGVEFSVRCKDSKVIHIVTIFNDTDDKKIRKIQDVFENGSGKSLYQNGAYSQKDYLDILKEINLDFVMIAHQKKSPSSKQSAKKSDVMCLGEEEFERLVLLEYFDAYEFHDKSNEIYNKIYALEKGVTEKLRFITGTDCHDWPSYPYYGPGKTEEVQFTYLKALPTFKGLAMAITDYHRINMTDSFFGQGKYIDNLELCINGKEIAIPMSRGINVVIGENSIGKSFILHALTDNRAILGNSKLKKGYQKYAAKNGINIKTHILENDIFKFNYQGYIREIFDNPDMKVDQYLKDFFPDAIDVERYKRPVARELERLYECIEKKFSYDKSVNGLNSFKLLLEEPADKELTIIGSVPKFELKDLHDLLKAFDKVIKGLEQDIIENKELGDEDKKHLETEVEFLEILKIKYENINNQKEKENSKINIFNTCISDFRLSYRERQTDEKNQYDNFIENKRYAIEDILEVLKQHKQIQPFQFQMKDMKVIPEENRVGDYVFVSKIGMEKIDNEYLNKLLQDVLRKDRKLDIVNMSSTSLENDISRFPQEAKDALDGLRIKINGKMDEEFKIRNSIIKNNQDIYDELSDGFNAQIYFGILTGEERNKGIYIIDQPEDHISQKAIKDTVLEQFRRMGRYRQVIMVTHNPQFIVNLDVDNVIFLSKDEEGIKVQSGALEYEVPDCNILEIVANNIDGGLETIKKRMKRYDKNLQI